MLFSDSHFKQNRKKPRASAPPAKSKNPPASQTAAARDVPPPPPSLQDEAHFFADDSPFAVTWQALRHEIANVTSHGPEKDVRTVLPLSREHITHLTQYYVLARQPGELDAHVIPMVPPPWSGLIATGQFLPNQTAAAAATTTTTTKTAAKAVAVPSQTLSAKHEFFFSPLHDPKYVDHCCQRGVFPMSTSVGNSAFVFAPKLHVSRAVTRFRGSTDAPPQPVLLSGGAGGGRGGSASSASSLGVIASAAAATGNDELFFDGRSLQASSRQAKRCIVSLNGVEYEPNYHHPHPHRSQEEGPIQADDIEAEKQKEQRRKRVLQEDLEDAFALIKLQHGDDWLNPQLRNCYCHMLTFPECYTTRLVLLCVRRRPHVGHSDTQRNDQKQTKSVVAEGERCQNNNNRRSEEGCNNSSSNENNNKKEGHPSLLRERQAVRGAILAAEIGFLVGGVYTSATGAYCSPGFGTMQLALLGALLEAAASPHVAQVQEEAHRRKQQQQHHQQQGSVGNAEEEMHADDRVGNVAKDRTPSSSSSSSPHSPSSLSSSFGLIRLWDLGMQMTYKANGLRTFEVPRKRWLGMVAALSHAAAVAALCSQPEEGEKEGTSSAIAKASSSTTSESLLAKATRSTLHTLCCLVRQYGPDGKQLLHALQHLRHGDNKSSSSSSVRSANPAAAPNNNNNNNNNNNSAQATSSRRCEGDAEEDDGSPVAVAVSKRQQKKAAKLQEKRQRKQKGKEGTAAQIETTSVIKGESTV